MSDASNPSAIGTPSAPGYAAKATATAKKTVRMIDEKTFSAKVGDAINAASTIKLLLVPRKVVQPTADNCLTFDVAMSKLEKMTIDVPSADGATQAVKTQLINVFSSAEQFFIGQS